MPEPAETLMVARVADLAGAAGGPPEGITLRTGDRRGGGRPDDGGPRRGPSVVHRPRIRQQLLDLLTEEPDTLAAVVAMAGDPPVSAARMEMRPGASFAGLWGGGTVPEWRGRGIYRALVAHRARIAAERGIPYLQVDASDQSRPILVWLGFEPLGVTMPYVWTAPAPHGVRAPRLGSPHRRRRLSRTGPPGGGPRRRSTHPWIASGRP